MILLLRHAEAAPGTRSADDHDRQLTSRGERDAGTVGRFLSLAGLAPDYIATSSATRARATAAIARAAGDWRSGIEVSDALYLPAPEVVLDHIKGVPESARCALLIGHEPGWSRTASRLVGGGRVELPPAGLVRVDVAADRWANVGFGSGALTWLLPPHVLRTVLGNGEDSP